MTEDEKQYLISGTTMPFRMWQASRDPYGGIAHNDASTEALRKALAASLSLYAAELGSLPSRKEE